MLIVFDLDDTLIDTSGSVAPFQMRRCLQKLIEEGFEMADFEASYQKLLEINESSSSSKEALHRFFLEENFETSSCSIQKPIFDLSSIYSELHRPLPQDFLVKKMIDADAILKWCKERALLALVTAGNFSFQEEKMKKAGLDSDLFSKIAISEGRGKGPIYEELLEEFSLLPSDIWVCGDRIEADLKPAKRLGFRTIHMKWGRGKNYAADWVDFTISCLNELKGIIE